MPEAEDRRLIGGPARRGGRWSPPIRAIWAARRRAACGDDPGFRPDRRRHRALRQAILDAVAPAGVFEHETGFITSLRHEQLLRECGRWIEKARAAVGAAIPHEMLLLDLYAALQPIDAITGGTTADDILNRIFSTFCIGK